MYAGESFLEYTQQEKLQNESGCFVDKSKQKGSLDKFNVSNHDFFKLLEGFEGFGRIEHKLYKENPSGPILVIFREDHENNQVKRENFEAFKTFKEYFNFLATEGDGKEIRFDDNRLKTYIGNFKLTISAILAGFTSFSSGAIELYYQDSIDTCGVDLPADKVLELKEKSIDLAIKTIFQNPRLPDSSFTDFVKDNTEKRNKLFLTNIRDIMISRRNGNGKNFIPIVTGGGHSDNLVIQARDFGFKGVIVFSPKSYKETPLY